MKKKMLALLLALCMVLGLAATVSADENLVTSGDWTYRAYSDGAVLCSYNGTATEVTVPATIDGLPVSELGFGLGCVFSGVADTLTTVNIENGIPLIDNAVFKGCTALKTVNIPASVTYIGSFAFQDCTALTEIELPEGLTHVGMFTFLNTGLTSIRIPSTVTDIGEYAFGCSGSLEDYDFIDGFTVYGYPGTAGHAYAEDHYFINFVDLGGCYDNSGRCGDSLGWEFTASTGTLRVYGPTGSPGGYMYLYDEAEEIPWAVHKPFIKNVVIEKGLDICADAFSGCTELTTVTMADTVSTIRAQAFMDTPNLTSIELSANLESISSDAFNSSGLTRIYLPEGLRSIGTQAFCNTPLTAIEIPDSVTSIAQGAFYRCTELASVKLPADLEEIPSLAFEVCTSLKTIDLPEKLIIIGRQAFSHSGLTSIDIPDSVVAIGDNAFYECLSLEYVKLPASLEEVGWRCFQDCDKLSTIVMPEGIDTNFGQWFFLSCDSLTNIDFHTSSVIGMAMYGNCNGLTVLNIPECVTTISDFAFNYCDNLIYATIPESVVTVGNAAFSYCGNLTAIAFRGDVPAFAEFAFRDTTLTAYYPADNATWTEEILQQYGGTITWVPYEVLPFVDVPVNSFYFAPVAWAVKENITTGTSATTFAPNAFCNRAQVVTFLWRAAGCPEPTATENPFVDVKEGDFFHKAVLWAVEKGITNGIDATHFGPNESCNRAQVVTFLYRAMQSPAISTLECPCTDVEPGQWYEPAVLWAVEKGITNGMSADTFGVNTVCNRAQVVTFLYRTYVD